LQGFDGVAFQYDDNGNTIEKNDNGNITKYFFNIEDRMVRVEDGAGVLIATYYYDPFGRRLWKEIDAIRTYFVYSNEGLVGEYGENGMEIKSYGYTPGSIWTTDPLFLKEEGHYYFYQNNHLGIPQKVTAVNGAAVWSAVHTSFGEADINPASTVTNNLRFAGQYYDQETRLHYNYNRYYDSRTGRYLRTDPIGFDGGINLYVYALSNPGSLTDPRGLICGSGLLDLIVPDAPSDFDFSAACMWHDECYGRCPKTGTNTSWGAKSQCDRGFHNRMRRICRTSYGGNRRCLSWADKYHWGVSRNSLAEEVFLEAQENCPGCEQLRERFNDFIDRQTAELGTKPIIIIYFD
jgi:RHS repeat-associated protein